MPKVDARAQAAVAVVLAKRRSRAVDDVAIQRAIQDAQDAAAARSVALGSFRQFLRHWHFISRETGQMLSFANLWEGQEQFVRAAEASDWLFALKAGKLGFTELECAFDVWRALAAHPYARVSLLSKDLPASKALLGYVKFGLRHLPAWFGVRILTDVPGGDTTGSVIVTADWMVDGDQRTITSYAATGNVAIDQTFAHAHVDELSHMADGAKVWASIATLIEPAGTCHVVTRGAGDQVYSYELWQAAKSGKAKLRPFFVPWTGRPDRDVVWREQESNNMSHLALAHYAPESEEDALMGDDVSPYIPLERWDALVEAMPPLRPGDRDGVVLSIDSAVTSDSFAITAVSRHPGRHTEAAIRRAWIWRPQDFADRRIDFAVPKDLVRLLCGGGCANHHPRTNPAAGCDACVSAREAKAWPIRPMNVVQVCYDPYQLEDFVQDLRREGLAWFSSYDQGAERLVGDANLFRLAMGGRVHWIAPERDAEGRVLNDYGMLDLREHVRNAKAKLQPEEESKMRIVKRNPAAKVDALVSAAMGVKRIMELNL